MIFLFYSCNFLVAVDSLVFLIIIHGFLYSALKVTKSGLFVYFHSLWIVELAPMWNVSANLNLKPRDDEMLSM